MKCYIVYARTYKESTFTLWETEEAGYEHVKRLLNSLDFQDMKRFMKKHRLKLKNAWYLKIDTNTSVHFTVNSNRSSLTIEYSYETPAGSFAQLALKLIPYVVDSNKGIDLRPDF